ncbi:MAG: hypothetical protein HeimAB125_03230 [Candidatus Heimdallarchaeota archaeon AB_125]|nr:MAG: hypothetical protein HeimAB125_03230 [Candidatus Heimdallarchaeota archaeon AB_125]
MWSPKTISNIITLTLYLLCSLIVLYFTYKIFPKRTKNLFKRIYGFIKKNNTIIASDFCLGGLAGGGLLDTFFVLMNREKVVGLLSWKIAIGGWALGIFVIIITNKDLVKCVYILLGFFLNDFLVGSILTGSIFLFIYAQERNDMISMITIFAVVYFLFVLLHFRNKLLETERGARRAFKNFKDYWNSVSNSSAYEESEYEVPLDFIYHSQY